MPTDPAVRPLTSMDEFAACEALQEQVWSFAERDLLPRRMFMVAHQTGGQVLGGWDGDRLAAFSLALPGFRRGAVAGLGLRGPQAGASTSGARGEAALGPAPVNAEFYWHSHMLAVAEEYRNRGLGRRLKLRQREEALALGLGRIEWTFDPLEAKNAYFNLEVLRVEVRRYYPNLYGFTSSPLQAGLPTDRMTAEWRLRSAGAGKNNIVQRIPIPAEIQAWKAAGDPRAATVQQRNREAFLAAFAAGLAVVGFDRAAEGGGDYLLAREVKS